MNMLITAKLLDQAGLILGFISGILLIPEVLSFFRVTQIEQSIEKRLYLFENWAKFPLRFSPPSWKYNFTEEQRAAIEPTTAIRSLVFSAVWIIILIVGVRFSSKICIFLSIVIVVTVIIGNMRKHIPSLHLYNPLQMILFFLGSLFILVIITPLVSLIRVIFWIFSVIFNKLANFFSTYDVLRSLLTIFAIIAFILSNILQFIATLL